MLSSNTSAVSGDANYIEDVFSTYLYTGTGSALTITNNIDIAGKGGLVWTKQRNGSYWSHMLAYSATPSSTASGTLFSNLTNAAQSGTAYVSTLTSSGYTLPAAQAQINYSGDTYSSWTFRKQPKFFDVVTYTGDGIDGREIAHSLGSVPGCMIVKSTSNANNWNVYHRAMDAVYANAAAYGLYLNSTDARNNSINNWLNTNPTSTVFTVGSDNNTNGRTYVAYLFAHNAGGFGLTGTDNVISCGSFTSDSGGIGQTVNLGYEPQWVLFKNATKAGDWHLVDTMRGVTVDIGKSAELKPNLSDAESVTSNACLVGNGFRVEDATNSTYIYIAIRRGPMKVPTDATKVFAPVAQNFSSNATVSTGFPVDLSISTARGSDPSGNKWTFDRLRGSKASLATSLDYAEIGAGTDVWKFYNNTAVIDNYWVSQQGASGQAGIYWNFRRAPSFFDVVCYTGTGSARTVTHNLQAVPELMIVKNRSADNWRVYSSSLLNTQFLALNLTDAVNTSTNTWNSTTPTASVFSLGGNGNVNSSGGTYVAYLFATCAGVSKCFNYTGNGSSQTINCGFTGGARWIMIKRTDSTGDWYIWDTARGIVSGNDPHLSLNTTAAEVTSDDTIDTDSTGFIVNQLSATNVNVTSATYIGIAIA